jgi:hypothetical protein
MASNKDQNDQNNKNKKSKSKVTERTLHDEIPVGSSESVEVNSESIEANAASVVPDTVTAHASSAQTNEQKEVKSSNERKLRPETGDINLEKNNEPRFSNVVSTTFTTKEDDDTLTSNARQQPKTALVFLHMLKL